MKKLDKLIETEISNLLSEQDINKTLLPYSSTNFYLSPLKPGQVTYPRWPIGVKAQKWPNPLAQLFLMGAFKAQAFRTSKDMSDVELAQKKISPFLAFNFGKETLVFHPDGYVEFQAMNKDAYWVYYPYEYRPFATTITPGFTGDADMSLSKPNTGHMILYTDRSHKTPALILLIEKNGQPNLRYFKTGYKRSKEDIAKAEKQYWRNVLDIVGFVPVVGDAADLYQSMWYLSDFKESGYKNTEDLIMSILSMIAVIPIYGSFAKLGIKKLVPKKGFTDLVEWFNSVTADAALDAKGKMYYAKLMVTLSKSFGSIKTKLNTAITKLGFESFDTVLGMAEKQIERAASTANDYLYNLERRYGRKTGTTGQSKKALDNAGKDVEKTELDLAKEKLDNASYKLLRTDKRVASLIYGYGKQTNAKQFVDGLFKVIPGNKWKQYPANILRIFSDATIHAARYGKARREMIVNGMLTTFIKAIKADRDKFALMLFHELKSPGPKVADIIKRASKLAPDLKRVDVDDIQKFKSKVKSIITMEEVPGVQTVVKQGGKNKVINSKPTLKPKVHNVSGLSIEQINDLLDKGGTYTIDATTEIRDIVKWLRSLPDTGLGNYSGVVEGAWRELIDNQNPLWKEVLIDPLNAAKAYFPKSLPELTSHFKANFGTIKKYLNDLYEAAGEFAEDLGIKDKDQLSTSIGYDLLRKVINKIDLDDDNILVQTYNSYKRLNTQGSQAIESGKAWAGIQDRSMKTPDIRLPGVHPDSIYVGAPPVPTANIRSTTNLNQSNRTRR